MKKILSIGITCVIASLVQATDILPAGSQISGPYSYIYQEPFSVLTGQHISDMSISYDITLTAGGPANIPNTLYIDLLNGKYASTGNSPINSGETTYDYFQHTSPYNGTGITDPLGSITFYAPGHGGSGKPYYDEETGIIDVATDLPAAYLAALANDISLNGYFDIGLDPNCTFKISSLTFTITTAQDHTVPDQAMTVCLLGMGFLGLLAFRRKLALN